MSRQCHIESPIIKVVISTGGLDRNCCTSDAAWIFVDFVKSVVGTLRSVQLGVGMVEDPRLTACGPEDDDDDCRCAVCVWMNLNSQEHVSPHTWSTTSSAS